MKIFSQILHFTTSNSISASPILHRSTLPDSFQYFSYKVIRRHVLRTEAFWGLAFIYGFLKNDFSSSDHVASKGKMINWTYMGGRWCGLFQCTIPNSPGKTRNPWLFIRLPCLDSKQAPSEYKPEALQLKPACALRLATYLINWFNLIATRAR
jgi:hypothetical protein